MPEKANVPVLVVRDREYQGEALTLRAYRYENVAGRVIDVYEREPGEFHVLFWLNGVLEDVLSHHRDPAKLLDEVPRLLGQGRIARGARALTIMSTFAASVQDAIDMQKGLK